jgi:hypothetical protein
MKHQLENIHLPDYPFVSKQVASQLTGLSAETLKKYRLEGKLQKEIHWISINPRVVKYNIVLILDWMQNHNSNPQGHLRAIENYLDSLPSNQKKNKRSLSPKVN